MYVCHLPTNLVEKNDVGSQECFMVECCPYCGLGFTPMWVGKLAFCKHVYHCWCATVHLNSFSKCIKVGCEEKMHEMWWRGGCKVGWLIFCITIQFLAEWHAFTCY
jgi:hypothetical protein